MELEKKNLRGAVIEGYTVLMRAEAELLLPKEKKEIGDFYITLTKKCMAWAIEVRGEGLRAEFLAAKSSEERARFPTRHYRFSMRYPWSDGSYAAILCESVLRGESGDSTHAFRRVSHVWNTEEEQMLPTEQILRLFYVRNESFRSGFKADGVYPENGMLVFYKNATKDSAFMEKRLDFGKNGKI